MARGRKPIVRMTNEQEMQGQKEEVITMVEPQEEIVEEVVQEESAKLPESVMTVEEALAKRLPQKVMYSDGFTNVINAAESRIHKINSSDHPFRCALFAFGSRNESETAAANANYEIATPVEVQGLGIHIPDHYVLGFQSKESFNARKSYVLKTAKSLVSNSKVVDGNMVSEQTTNQEKIAVTSANVILD